MGHSRLAVPMWGSEAAWTKTVPCWTTKALSYICHHVRLGMNYAEDRLDRRARHVELSSSKDGLWTDYQRGLDLIGGADGASWQGHELLGRTLRDVGWCRHAAYHYGVAWGMAASSNESAEVLAQRAGDYAQMAEFAGFPDVAALSLLHHRARGALQPYSSEFHDTTRTFTRTADPQWLRRQPVPTGHCGCGSTDCGTHACYLPMRIGDLEPILTVLESFHHKMEKRVESKDMPSAYSVLSFLAKPDGGDDRLAGTTFDLHSLLQFWDDTNDPDYLALEPVLQLLLVKLLYLTVPSLASLALVHVSLRHKRNVSLARHLAHHYKSHYAYYVLMEQIVLGERIKPHRVCTLPAYHVPVWNLIWNLEERRRRQGDMVTTVEGNATDTTRDCESSCWSSLQDNLRHRLASCGPCNNHEFHHGLLPPPTQLLAARHSCKPLYVVGDSHVLSIAWQTVWVDHEDYQETRRLLVPLVVTGLKAWHTQSDTAFFTHTLLRTCLSQHLASTTATTVGGSKEQTRTILFSAGEIDCREGMGGPLLEGYHETQIQELQPIISSTVREYVRALESLALEYDLQILVLSVAPHAHRSVRNGKTTGRNVRRFVTHLWNGALQAQLEVLQQQQQRSTLVKRRVFWLDYSDELQEPEASSAVGYVLKEVYNADYTHMNSAFLPHLERAIQKSGCNMDIL